MRQRLLSVQRTLPSVALPWMTELGSFLFTWLRTYAAAESANIWGDGFADDGLHAMAGVRSFDQIEPDEYVRLFPNLVLPRPTLHPILREHLRSVADGRDLNLRSRSLLRNRFEIPGGQLAEPYMTFIDDESIAVPPYDEEWAMSFAFHSGVHPAYIWPEALGSHEALTTAGWLGVVARGRPALMPREVASCLQSEFKRDSTGRLSLRNDPLSHLLGGRIDLEALVQCSERTLGGSGLGLYRATASKRLKKPPFSSVGLAFARRPG